MKRTYFFNEEQSPSSGSEAYTNCQQMIKQLRNDKLMRREKYYNPRNLQYNHIDVPVQNLCPILSTHSLNKKVDTPVRETMSCNANNEDDSELEALMFYVNPGKYQFYLTGAPAHRNFIDEELGTSFESTAEERTNTCIVKTSKNVNSGQTHEFRP